MRLAAPLLAFVLLTGCAALDGGAPPSEGDGLPELPALRFGAPVRVLGDAPGGEPVIDVAPDGTIFVEGIGFVAEGGKNIISRSDDGGATWVEITPPGTGREDTNDGFVEVGTDGTVYGANVFQLTLQLFRSTDKGATWTPLPAPRVPAAMHRHWIVAQGDTVHLAMEALPPGFAGALVGGPGVSQLGTLNEGMWYHRSDDAGMTWSAPQQIDPIVNFAGQGQMVVSEDGQRLYIPRYEEDSAVEEYTYDDGRWYLLVSEDGGASWERREMFDLTGEISTAVPSLALDAAGTLYFGWSQVMPGAAETRAVYAVSRDGGATWSAPRQLSTTPGTHAMAWIAAKAPGEIGAMWYTAAANGTAREVDASWFVDYTLVTGADTDAPTMSEVRLTPESVHEGNICAKGPACAGGEDRSLLDYPWMVFHEGRAHVVFPSTKSDVASAIAVVVVESG